MSTITPHYRSVQQLLQNQFFSIDEYQREYKWGKKHIEELLSDLLGKFQNSYNEGDEKKKVSTYEEYFLGSIIVSKRNGKNYLIDGQQRITSLTLLLIFLYRTAELKELDVTKTIAPLIFSDDLGEHRFNLDIPERLSVIEALFKGMPFNPDGKDESIQNMHARYGEIEANDFLDELGDGLTHFIYWLMTKVGLIEIATDNDSYAYAIFETMNDRGMPLSPVDMLKAYLLAPIEDSQLRKKANEIWKNQVFSLISWGGPNDSDRDSHCIKAWLRAQYAETIRERKAGASDKDWEIIGTVFHRWVRDNSQRLNLGSENKNLAMITESFPFFARAYIQILKASQNYIKGLEPVFYNAHNDFTWQNTVLLAPLLVTDDSDIVRRKIAVTATFLDIWLMRRVVNYIRVGYSSASYAMWLLCREIRRKSVDDLIEFLSDKLNKDEVTFQGSPSRGRQGIRDLKLNQFSRRYIYHLLARVTAFTEVGAGRGDPFANLVDRQSKNPFDVEHIWAEDYLKHGAGFNDLHEFHEWRNHVASLVLLPADVNRSLQDKSYQEKIPHYARQNFYAASLSDTVYKHQPQFRAFQQTNNLPFKAYQIFGKKEQKERMQLLETLVEQIWSPDRLRETAK
jgi:uncharacterized protein with ParB-like and HNH nuclease domain